MTFIGLLYCIYSVFSIFYINRFIHLWSRVVGETVNGPRRKDSLRYCKATGIVLFLSPRRINPTTVHQFQRVSRQRHEELLPCQLVRHLVPTCLLLFTYQALILPQPHLAGVNSIPSPTSQVWPLLISRPPPLPLQHSLPDLQLSECVLPTVLFAR